MIVLIDNYDSFTYNLVQGLGALGTDVRVHRNDALTVDAVLHEKPQGILISPGPGTPDESGICLSLIAACAAAKVPLFGVCLGHQAIGQVFGGRVIRAPSPLHGKTSPVLHEGEGVFAGLPSPFPAARYHSLIVERENLPQTLSITAQTQDGIIMGLRHKTLPIEGVQFHPESIATGEGPAMLKNILLFFKDAAHAA